MGFDIVLGLITAGIAMFSVSLLLPLIEDNQYLMPLAAFIIIQSIIALEPLVFHSLPHLEIYYIALSALIWMLMMPSLWLYIKGLTATFDWQWRKAKWHHTWLSLFGFVVGLAVLCLPESSQLALFSDSEYELTTSAEVTVAVLILMLLIIWPVQSTIYVCKIIMCLSRYRKNLRQVFANEKDRRLYWVNIVLIFLIISWLCLLWVLFSSLTETKGGDAGALVMFFNLISVWLFSFCALAQKPPFMCLYKQIAKASINCEPNRIKYEKSAIDDTQAQRIAKKLTRALQDEHLYLNNDLTLYWLAEYLHIPAHYISQTLNQTMHTSFFDWVNRARVEQAQKLLLGGNIRVLDVALAVGFNSRSVFYKAFKAYTGTTPSTFKKRNNLNKADEP
jgi:AraC-like DNA-binding protein